MEGPVGQRLQECLQTRLGSRVFPVVKPKSTATTDSGAHPRWSRGRKPHCSPGLTVGKEMPSVGSSFKKYQEWNRDKLTISGTRTLCPVCLEARKEHSRDQPQSSDPRLPGPRSPLGLLNSLHLPRFRLGRVFLTQALGYEQYAFKFYSYSRLCARMC